MNAEACAHVQVINFTTGLTVSVFFFLASLPSLLASYQPGWVSAGAGMH